MRRTILVFILLILAALPACGAPKGPVSIPPDSLQILAVEPFLADITKNVVGDLAPVDSLIPLGMDPHAYEPNPEDVVKIAKSQLFVINGGGLEEAWLQKTIQNAGGNVTIIIASAGLDFRKPQPGEVSEGGTAASQQDGQGDPHFWLDPNLVKRYVENIRDGISQKDPKNQAIYAENAAEYIDQLSQLDLWIKDQVSQIPAEKRLLVTNHESLGYFADRYGFKIIGTIVPSYSSLAAPSAQQITSLVNLIRSSGVKAIFIESGSNLSIASQIANETGVTLVDTLYDHTLTDANGPAPNYIEMMRYDVNLIVKALK
jgi:ABC-type Zn uptake system ZnuABC Zn-binding protein ZnuA